MATASKSKKVAPKKCYECGGKHRLSECGKNWYMMDALVKSIAEGGIERDDLDTMCRGMAKNMLFRVAHRVGSLSWSGSKPKSRIARHDDTRVMLTRDIMSYGQRCAIQRAELNKETLDNAMCPICFEDFDVITTKEGQLKVSAGVTTSCGHSFCVKCYTRHVAMPRSNMSCPMCRGALI